MDKLYYSVAIVALIVCATVSYFHPIAILALAGVFACLTYFHSANAKQEVKKFVSETEQKLTDALATIEKYKTTLETHVSSTDKSLTDIKTIVQLQQAAKPASLFPYPGDGNIQPHPSLLQR